MSDQDERSTPITNSQSNIANIYTEQKEVSKAFEINNFYLNQRFNIKELKQKIENRKQQHHLIATLKGNHLLMRNVKKKYDLSPNEPSPDSSIIRDKNDSKMIKVVNSHNRNERGNNKRRMTQQKQKRSQKNYVLLNKQFKSYDHTAREQRLKESRYRKFQSTNKSFLYGDSQKTMNYRINKGHQEEKLKNRTLIHQKQRQPAPFYENLQLKLKNRLAKSKTQVDDSRFSGIETQNSYDWGIQGKIIISNEMELQQFQRKILLLWQHYELLSRILQIIIRDFDKSKYFIAKYRDFVCTNKIQFIRDMIELLCDQGYTKKELQFLKRMRKSIILSRLFEHLSIIFLSLQFYVQRFSMTHLTNMIGYASSNLINIIKFVILSYSVQYPLKVSSTIEEKILIITSFEISSYGTKLNKISEVILRIEQNNNVMNIIKNKLELEKEFLQIINGCIKMNNIETNLLEDYSHYLFEYFAFFLISKNTFGYFQSIEIAPVPYLALQKPRTIVIEPWHVLFSMKEEVTFIRAYSDQFLNEISQHCNIVYWTDLLPNQINNLLEKLPTGYLLYRYHCKYENGGFFKPLQRLGCDLDNTIIIDRSQFGFKHNREMGIQLPWNGTKRDMKLLDLLEALHNILEEVFNDLSRVVHSVRVFQKQKRIQQKKERFILQRLQNHSEEFVKTMVEISNHSITNDLSFFILINQRQ